MPFDGLTRRLRKVVFEARETETAGAMMQEHLAELGDEVQVSVRTPVTEVAPAPWTISKPEYAGAPWSTYGSFAEQTGAARETTEYDALRAARRTLREQDPGLLRRLDFDPEAAGTAILARHRDDLVAALRILGIRQA